MYLEDKADVIVDYLSDARYKQAVLINGVWGTGKTFFVDKVLSKKLTDIGYIVMRHSLYGANSCEQIRKDIDNEMLIKICSEKINIPPKILELAPDAIKYFTKKVGFESEDFDKVIEKIDYDKSKIVIIFDDLERTTAEINDVLGLINSYVENKELKVIIVANENEIGSSRISSDLPSKFSIAVNSDILLPGEEEKRKAGNNNSNEKNTCIKYDELISRTKTIFSNDIIYNSIKEKLVGLSITLNTNFHQLYEDIVDKYATDSTKNFLYSNKDKALEILQMQECQNLRTLIFSIITFDKIYSSLISLKCNINEYNQLLEDELLNILRYVIYESIQYREGKDVQKCNESDSTSRYLSCLMAKVKEYKFVNQFIIFHEFNIEETKNIIDSGIKNNIQKKKEDEEREKLSYYKLTSWEWIYLNDDDVIKYSNSLYEEIKAEKYDAHFFKGIIIFLLQLDVYFMEKRGYIEHKIAEYIELMKTYICNHDSGQYLLDELSIIPDNSDFTQKYNECIKPLVNAYKSQNERLQKNIHQDLFADSEWEKKFSQYCQDNHDSFLHSQAFLSSFDIEKILEKLKGANNAQISEFAKAVCSVYNFGNIRDYFKSDIINLNKIIDLFQEMYDDINCECTKKIILNNYKERLNRKLEALK